MNMEIKSWKTTNGARVLHVHRSEVQMIEIIVAFNAGSARDGGQYGVSQLTNMLLKQGTKNLNNNQIAEKFEEFGARFYTTSDRDTSTIGMMSLSNPKNFEPTCSMFSDIISSSVFSQSDLERSKQKILSAFKQQERMPDIIARNTLYSELYQNHSYAHPVLGTYDSVLALSLNDICNFYNRYYTSKDAIIIFVGAITQKKARIVSEQLTQNLTPGDVNKPIPLAPLLKNKVERKIFFPSEQTHFVLGQIAVNFNDPNYFPLLIGCHILGGSSASARLFKEVRDKHGLTYNITCRLNPMKANGLIVINFTTRNHEAQKALSLTYEVIDRFCEKGPTQHELMLIKKKIINGFPLSVSSNEDIARSLLNLGIYHLPLTYLDTYCDKINTVTALQIKNAIESHLQLSKITTVIVGNL